ncbi:MAG: ribbon-helix-helix domain-containing protein [Bacteroidota bacterium]|uniref:Antitoxin ParD1/3/4 n=1 Tax=Algoriphagus faecimaris TaxID=686796 RepID=A0A1G6V9E5_9BACT|nr:addiction module antitoxin [Algoriphagus faecimaris]SDD49446.1 antitoxin ParD1/3/4 [Algoriphagus faecimaris]
MKTVRKTITVTQKQSDWIKSRLEAGDFTNESEYIRDLLRKDQYQNSEFTITKALIEEGLESGVSEAGIPEIMREVEEKMKRDGRL